MRCLKRNLISTSTGVALAAALALTSVTGATAAPLELSGSASAFRPINSAVMAGGGSSAEGDDPEARVAWATILGAVVTAGGSADFMRKAAAQRMYHAGLRNPEYQQIKWSVRAMAIGAIGPIFGVVFMTSFENKFYALIR